MRSMRKHPRRLVLLGFVLSSLWTISFSPLALAQEDAQKCCIFGIHGQVFRDYNGDGTFNGTDTGLVGWTVEVVEDATNMVTSSTTTLAGGFYTLSVPIGCTVPARVRCVPPPGWTQTFPLGTGEHSATWGGCSNEQFGPYDFAYNDPPCDGVSVTYTDDPDFLLGTLSGVVTNVNQLELAPTGTTFEYAWIANTQEGTLSKVDTNTGREVGRYYTGPPNTTAQPYNWLYPSRTAVDEDGNCWVLNRAFGGQTSMTQVLTTGGDDRNFNTIIETSQDANSNGVIDATEILPWGQDERVIRHYLVGGGAADGMGRGLTIDKMGYLWVALFSGQRLVKLDPNEPTAIHAPNLPPTAPPELVSVDLTTAPGVTTPYGLALGPNGNLYVATGSEWAFEVDPGVASGGTGAGPGVTQWIYHPGGYNYGIAVDRDCIVWLAKASSALPNPPGCIRWDPAVGFGVPSLGWSHSTGGAPTVGGRGITVDFNGDIWMASPTVTGDLVKYSPTNPPTWTANYPSPVNSARGVAVANDGNVIGVGLSSSSWAKLNVASGANIPLPGPQLVGNQPYSYSDFTGSLQNLVSKQQGFWNVVTDGGSNGLSWTLINWTDAVPPGTSVTVEARSSASLGALSALPWQPIAAPGPLSPTMPGRYLETRVRLAREIECGEPFITPILYDLTVEAECDSCFFVSCEDITVPCDTPAGAIVNYPFPVTTADCDTTLGVTCTPPPGSLFPIGNTPVLCTAFNSAGDTLTCSFTVTVTGDCIQIPTGACCVDGVGCTVTTEAQCDLLNGTYYGDGSDCNNGCEFLCLKPPRDMSMWLPLNSVSAGMTANLADASSPGNVLGAPAPVSGQHVVNALNFDGTNDYVQVVNAPSVDLGSDDLSIDFWVRIQQQQGFATVLDKRSNSGSLQGYHVFLLNGYPGLQLAVGGGFSNWSLSATNGGPAAFVGDGDWHMVAITVDRNDPTGGRFYVDGAFVGTAFNPTARAGNLNNAADLWVGRHQFGGQWMRGDLDEIEIFRRELTAEEVQLLAEAGTAGKCPEACYAVTRAQCCDNGQANTSITICNYDDVSHVYSWGLTPLASSPGCSGSGATTFNPSNGTVTVAAGTCVSIPVDIVCPSDLQGGQEACYQVSIYNHDTGRVFGCRGSVRKPSWWCLRFRNGREPAGNILNVSSLATDPVSLDVIFAHVTPLPAPVDLTYRLEAVTSDESAPSSIVSLDGLPPGVPVTGTLEVPPGKAASEVTLQVDVSVEGYEPLQYDKILVWADDDMDGEEEVIAEMAVRSTVGSPTAVEEDVAPQTQRPFRALPNPFNPTARIAFEVSGTGLVPVSLKAYDLRGRLVKTIYHKQPMEAGSHEVIWRGDDHRGQSLASGVYILTLETPDAVETVKAVLVK